MKIFGAWIILLALAITPAWAQDEFAKEIYAEIGNSVRAEYETMLAAIARDSLTNPPRDEVSRIERARELERKSGVSSF